MNSVQSTADAKLLSLLRAGEDAVERRAFADAEEFYGKSLAAVTQRAPAGSELDDELGVRALLHRKRGSCRYHLGQLAEAVDDLEAASKCARGLDGEPEELHLTSLGRLLAEHDHAMARQLDVAQLRYAALRGLCSAYQLSHQLEPLVTNGKAFLSLAERWGDQARQAEALSSLAGYELRAGNFEAVRSCGERALELAAQAGNTRAELHAFHALAQAHYFRSHYGLALECAQQALQRLSVLPETESLLPQVRFLIGLIQAHQGQLAEALNGFAKLSAAAATERDEDLAARTRLALGALRRELQLPADSAERIAPEATAYLETQADFCMSEARILARRRRGQEAAEQLDRASSLLEPSESLVRRHPVRRAQLRLLAARGEVTLLREERRTLAADAAKLGRQALKDGAPKYIALAHSFDATASRATGNYDEAEKSLRRALALFDEAPAPLLTWKLWMQLGFVLRAKQADPAPALDRAREQVTALADQADDATRSEFTSQPTIADVLKA